MAVGGSADALLNEGVRLSRQPDLVAAEFVLRAAVESYRAGLPDGAARRGLPRALWRLATVQYQRGQVVEAVESAMQAHGEWQSLLLEASEPNSLDIAWELARCCADLSVFTFGAVLKEPAGDPDRPVHFAGQALALARRMVTGGHPKGEIEEGTAWHNLAVAHLNRGEMDQARKAIVSAVRVRERLFAGHEATHLTVWELANTCYLLGHIAMVTGDVAQSVDALIRALELAVPLGPDGEDVVGPATMTIRHLRVLHPDAFTGRRLNICLD